MTRDDIIRMAREAGVNTHHFDVGTAELERFAALVVAAALAEQEAEPVAWKVIRSDGGDVFLTGEREIAEATAHNYWTKVPLYTAPPRREWQSLTDEEVKRTVFMWSMLNSQDKLAELVRLAERFVREKNT